LLWKLNIFFSDNSASCKKRANVFLSFLPVSYLRKILSGDLAFFITPSVYRLILDTVSSIEKALPKVEFWRVPQDTNLLY